MSCEEHFIAELRGRGFRLTPQREIVLKVLHEIEGTATAEQIHHRVQEISSSIDISTVYRTLELLGEFQMVAAMDLGDSQRRYALLGVHGPHAHLQCRACGKLIGVQAGEVQDFAERLRRQYGFELDLGQLMIPGLCAECQEAESEPSSNAPRQ